MKRIVTGIKPTGDIHIGNYAGAIKPALNFMKDNQLEPFYFIANMHALNSVKDTDLLKKQTLEVAATWIALGLDPQKATFFRQSDIPELFELNWILANLTSKGLMNRAHAYKAMVDQNNRADIDMDTGVNMGLFNYPILMSADILMFNADVVPVGKDQVQHIEIARDLAEQFNHTFGETFKLPNYYIEKEVAVLPGLDGRKMSKSYQNTIPLFCKPKRLQKLIKQIKTDSSLPSERKDPTSSPLFTMYQAFATADETLEMKRRFELGIGWGEVKESLYTVMNRELEKPRVKYEELIAQPAEIEKLLAVGAEKARSYSAKKLKEIKEKVGLL
ncbi:tryptophanyl-tRNA synthetase [Alkalihalobacillus alcalophilus ATCC 27647 = CGMCC 1.3604]|uniref:Tryptophan--tRNA ligase n=1 Tax=Alkalihalobacillus alcalophilus ATCC 27647 = CGMCC 1.3604 TaxID=1218173 RepID=A0A094XAA8_ALKAL|nr:tryptophan--tRNA ligase [Alkalihalobacillus alcalophilus]KGA95700.1 tryptophan--tRNA ligase [Alkalihalobacillus alcalophilus ATCC 27647 = CGMCC 1.3604]MED1564125.1 tryptophan--tRNA ligase [Alkalihalobacillus alcalophilus]THG90590.1 tryptophanyl-tRNA synthetase [Alkalihalobacillus alcalophilus ATCC 27647 = CGMCC 1.3604]